MNVTVHNIKIGDKVVWNKKGIEHITSHYRSFDFIFKDVVYGVVTSLPYNSVEISVDWLNYKGFKIKNNWFTAIKHIDFYEDSN